MSNCGKQKPPPLGRGFLLIFNLLHIHHFFDESFPVEVLLAGGGEGDDAGLESEEGVILAHADIYSWEDTGAALAYDDRALFGGLAFIELGAQVFGL